MPLSDRSLAVIAVLVVLTAACRGSAADRGQAAPDSTAQMAPAPESSASVPAGSPVSATTAEIDSVQAQVDSMVHIAPSHMEAIVTRHVLTGSNMLAGMAADLRRAGVTGDASWTATVDSVRQDFTRMRTLTPKQVAPFLQSHARLVHRLRDQYTTLMASAAGGH
jgi:hypothetical protein